MANFGFFRKVVAGDYGTGENCIIRYILAVFLLCITATSIKGQSRFEISEFGSEVGGTLLTSSLFSNPVSSQYRFFAVHDIDTRLSGEVNAGFGFLSNPLQKSRLYDLEYRIHYTLSDVFHPKDNALSRRFNPFLYAGLGISRYQRLNVDPQSDPLLQKSGKVSNSAIWNNGSGWVARLPLGIGASYRLDDITAIRLTGGYQLLAGQSVVKNNAESEGFLGATLGLSFRPFGSDWDNDRTPTSDEMRHVLTYPDNPDTDGDGLLDGEELYFHKTNPRNPDTDGDGLSDGSELMIHFTNPLLFDTDGGMVSDGKEVARSSNPLNRADDRPLAYKYRLKIESVSASDVSYYRSMPKINYSSLGYELTKAAKEQLQPVVNILEESDSIQVSIKGFTDKNGDSIMNRSLSNVRAWKVAEYFLEQGISFDRIITQGYGEDYPVRKGYSPDILARNRRSELYLGPHISKVGNVYPLNSPSENMKSVNIAFNKFSDSLSIDAKIKLNGLIDSALSESATLEISAAGYVSGSMELNRMLVCARTAAITKYLIAAGIDYETIRISEGPKENRKYGMASVKLIQK